MIQFITIFLFCLLVSPNNSCSSSFNDSSFIGPDADYDIIINDKTFPLKTVWIEKFNLIKIEETGEHPLCPGFKAVNIGVPHLDATALEFNKLDNLILSFDSSRFSSDWYLGDKKPYFVYLKLPIGEITGGCVLLHGADSVHDIDFIIANRLTERGKLVVIPLLFLSHGIKESVASNQTAIPLEQTVVAAFRMLHFIKSHPDMADKSVSLLGRSRGAMVTDLCARSFYQEHISPAIQFNRFVMIDGFVFRNEENPRYTEAPMLFMQGELDTWTPLRFVQRHVEILKSKNYPVELKVFEGGHHAFLKPASTDGNETVEKEVSEKEVQTFKNCTFIDNGAAGFTPLIYDKINGILMESEVTHNWDNFPNFIMENMVQTDIVHVGSKGEYTEDGLKMIEDFLNTSSH